MTKAPVDVAVAVIEAPGKRFLLAQRPPGKPMAGYWEFPGGKVEPNETVATALAREIEEELGLTVLEANPWVTTGFIYPHATVRLHFMRVRHWHGTPEGREAQAFRFERIDEPLVEPWLPGALPLKRWLQVGERYAISDATRLGLVEFLARFEKHAMAKGIGWLLLREPQLDERTFDTLYRGIVPRARSLGVRVLISSRHPERYWHEADGVHLTRDDLFLADARPRVNWVFASCHDRADLVRAGQMSCDAAMLGAVEATASHPGALPLGWSGFTRLVIDTPLPVFALGGLNWNAPTFVQARACGAHGIAAQRSAWQD